MPCSCLFWEGIGATWAVTVCPAHYSPGMAIAWLGKDVPPPSFITICHAPAHPSPEHRRDFRNPVWRFGGAASTVSTTIEPCGAETCYAGDTRRCRQSCSGLWRGELACPIATLRVSPCCQTAYSFLFPFRDRHRRNARPGIRPVSSIYREAPQSQLARGFLDLVEATPAPSEEKTSQLCWMPPATSRA